MFGNCSSPRLDRNDQSAVPLTLREGSCAFGTKWVAREGGGASEPDWLPSGVTGVPFRGSDRDRPPLVLPVQPLEDRVHQKWKHGK